MHHRNVIRFVFSFVLVITIISPLVDTYSAYSNPDKLRWSIITTPTNDNFTVVSGSEVNIIAIDPDGTIFYAADIPHGKIYKSEDSGITWKDNIIASINSTAGMVVRAWNLAIAPDDPNFVVVTANKTADGAIQRVFISTDGGANWVDTHAETVISPAANICALAISPLYGTDNHDIAIGTRTGIGTGAVYILKTPSIGGWANQSIAPSTGWTPGDVMSLKFSPNYQGDSCLAIVQSTLARTIFTLGSRDTASNRTDWAAIYAVPVEITTAAANTSPNINQIKTVSMQMPSDFHSQDLGLRRIFIAYDDNAATGRAGIYRVDNILPPYRIFTATPTDRISSIAYFGTYNTGLLIAGEVKADPATAMVEIWRTEDAYNNPPTWVKEGKFPTGGGNTGYANAQLAFNGNGDRIYCGTSSANLDIGIWPSNLSAPTAALDESAFSVSPNSSDYFSQLNMAGRRYTGAIGQYWTQIAFIDTEVTFLSDVASLEAQKQTTYDYSVLYLATVNTNLTATRNFDSVWRSVSAIPGTTWERILCTPTTNNGILLRVNSRLSMDALRRSTVIVFADYLNTDIRYSSDEGAIWTNQTELNLNIIVKDIALGGDNTIFVVDDRVVRKAVKEPLAWKLYPEVPHMLESAHSIYVLPETADTTEPKNFDERWLLIGDMYEGRISYCSNWYQRDMKFKQLPPTPQRGNVHVIADEKIKKNRIIYAAISSPLIGQDGKIFRWTLDSNTEWTAMQPPNSDFYGIAQRYDTLYGAWNATTTAINSPGVDRTLYPSYPLSRSLEWDYLIEGLPKPGAVNYRVQFTREPSSLKVSSDENNSLWAIDNRAFNWPNKIGCLWAYTDTLARNGPWPTSPPINSYLPFDPVTGRSDQINFIWQQLEDASIYEIQISKDESFSQTIIIKANIVPPLQEAPAYIMPPGVLEANHKYFWRVRASGGITGEIIHSPWSATMYFTIQAGLPVTSYFYSPTLLQPSNGCACPCDHQVSFSWSPYKEIKTYLFELSQNADLSNPIVSVKVPTTAYKYEGALKCNTGYFWRVKAVEPFPSDWSATFTFITRPQLQSTNRTAPTTASNYFNPIIWVMIFVLFLLVTTIIIYIMISPRTSRTSAPENVRTFDGNSKLDTISEKIRVFINRLRRP